MLDIKFIREHTDEVINAAKKKRKDIDIDKIIKLDDERKELQKKLDDIRAQKNTASKEIPSLSGKEREDVIKKMKEIGDQEEELNSRARENEEMLSKLLLSVPNIVASHIPDGVDSNDNVEVLKWGDVRKFDFEPKDHVSIMQDLDMLDVDRGVKVAGARGYFLKGDGMLLEQALLRFALDHIVKKGFVPLSTPYIVNPDCFKGTGYFPGGEDDAFYCEKDDKYLIATSEIPIMAYHKDEIIDKDKLPLLYAGYSTCFRREAGSYGKDIKGLYRIHQFNKVEQVVIMPADLDESVRMYNFIFENALEIVRELEIPHRVLQLCGGDMSLGKYDTKDIECWMYSRGGYGETHSVSNMLDFQCRRMNIRYRNDDGSIVMCYSLNNTALATPRFLISLIEHYQNEDGSITIPKALVPYMGKKKITK